MTCQRRWTKHMAAHYWESTRRNENMHSASFDVSWCQFARFVSKNSRRSLQFSSTRLNPLHLTQIGAQKTQRKRCCPSVLVSSPSSIGEATRSYNFLISP